jgi:hypothetical protein
LLDKVHWDVFNHIAQNNGCPMEEVKLLCFFEKNTPAHYCAEAAKKWMRNGGRRYRNANYRNERIDGVVGHAYASWKDAGDFNDSDGNSLPDNLRTSETLEKVRKWTKCRMMSILASVDQLKEGIDHGCAQCSADGARLGFLGSASPPPRHRAQ